MSAHQTASESKTIALGSPSLFVGNYQNVRSLAPLSGHLDTRKASGGRIRGHDKQHGNQKDSVRKMRRVLDLERLGPHAASE